MPGTIELHDGSVQDLTFIYGNCARMTSRSGTGFYYRFELEEGRLNANAHIVKAIAENWPGRLGSMRIERHSAASYTISNVNPSENAQYALDMCEWNNNTRKYEPISFDLGTTVGQPETGATTPPQNPPSTATSSSPTPATIESNTQWDDITDLMRFCLLEAKRMWEMAQIEAQGDHAKAIQALAVSLYIDARKMGITVPTDDRNELIAQEVDDQELPF